MKFINVNQPFFPPFEEYCREIEKIWESKIITNEGKKLYTFESELKNNLKCDNLTLVCNGHSALESALQNMNLSGEVITTPYTFISTLHAIVRSGLKPVFCDINPDDYTINADLIESLITDKTCAILPVHIYGNVCDVEKINYIAKKYDLKVIYDAAQAFGVEYKNQNISNFGDITCFSLHATKLFHAVEGGIVCSNNKQIIKKIREFKNFGFNSNSEIENVGSNMKISELHAAMGICNLKYIDNIILRRKKLVKKYVDGLSSVKDIILPIEKKDIKNNYNYFIITFASDKYRDDIARLLLENNVETKKYFCPLVYEYGCYKNVFSNIYTPVAKKMSLCTLALPLYYDLLESDVEKIIDIIRNYFERN